MIAWVYNLPLWSIVLIIAGLLLLWTILGIVLNRKAWKFVNIILFVTIATTILVATIFTRKPGSDSTIVLTPLYSFREALNYSSEYYRELLMNAFLFLPLGLTFPFAIPARIKLKPLLTCGVAFLLSISIEAIQYFWALGRCETDDVIMNVGGAAVGTLAFVVVKAWRFGKSER